MNRDDVLQELGLRPLWRLRARAPATQAAEPAVEAVMRDAAVATFGAVRSGEERSDRIAALSWKDFAADVDACTACGLCKTRDVRAWRATRAGGCSSVKHRAEEDGAASYRREVGADKYAARWAWARPQRSSPMRSGAVHSTTARARQPRQAAVRTDRQIELIRRSSSSHWQERRTAAGRREYRQQRAASTPFERAADDPSCFVAQLARQGEARGRFMFARAYDAHLQVGAGRNKGTRTAR
jgi:hypothetical protein